MVILKQIAAALALFAICIGLYYAYTWVMPQQRVMACTDEAKICPDGSAVGRTGANCAFAACPHGDALFEADGTVVFSDPMPNGTGSLVYTKDGMSYTKQLAFDSESMCASGNVVVGCLTLNVSIDAAFAGKPVHVSGIDRGADLLVRRLETSAAASSTPATPQTQTVTASIGQTVPALGISLTPLAVVDDSRCPAGVQCIWAGTVHVSVRIISGGVTSTATVELGHAMTTDAAFITLTAVAPAHAAGEQPAAADYRLTFEIAKR